MSGCDNPACQQIQPPCLLDPGVARYITPSWVVRRPPKNPSVLSDQSALFQQELPSSVTERFSTNIWCLSERGEGRKKQKKFGWKQSVRTILMEIADRRGVPASLRPQVSEQPVSCRNWPAAEWRLLRYRRSRREHSSPALTFFPSLSFIKASEAARGCASGSGGQASQSVPSLPRSSLQRYQHHQHRHHHPQCTHSSYDCSPASLTVSTYAY